MRAREPDSDGFAERDGVKLAYEVFGDDPGRPTVVLLPTWQIVHSRHWKAQVPYLARHFRVVTFDGRGSGRSSRPAGAAAYTNLECAADVVTVLDATATDRAVLVGLSCGATWAVHTAADHPDRVEGLLAIAPSCGLDVAVPDREAYAWDGVYETTEGWAKYNRRYWLEGDYSDFLQFFFGQMFTEPHSTKQIEDTVGWGHEIEPQTLADATAGRLGCDGAVCASIEEACSRVRCPVLVAHGDDDHIRPDSVGKRLAELTGGSFVSLAGCGHGPHARHPVKINELIRGFVERLHPTAAPVAPPTWTRAASRPRRALYLSSPIGLGHARRDLAIARALRTHHPDLQIDWLAQEPVTRVLSDAGEAVHTASAWLSSETAHIDAEAGEHDLHAFQAIRRMDEILVNNFGVFRDLVDETPYDLVIGDEAWDVDYFLHENPELKRFAFAWMTDFVGWLPMPDGGDREVALTADYNAEMIEQRARFQRVRDRSVFVGDPDDIVPDDLGPGLPLVRDWTEDNFVFAGYVNGVDPVDDDERAALRAELRYGDDERVCVVTVGGSGVGEALAAAGPRRSPGGAAGRRRAAVRGRRRPAHRPAVAAAARRRRRPGVRPRPVPAPRRLRHGGGPGRAHDVHGADGQPAAVRVRAVAASLRAEHPRPAPPRAVRGGATARLRRGVRPRRPGGDHRRRDRPPGRLPPGRHRRPGPRRGPHRRPGLSARLSRSRVRPA